MVQRNAKEEHDDHAACQIRPSVMLEWCGLVARSSLSIEEGSRFSRRRAILIGWQLFVVELASFQLLI
jgi:hypothetical protein